MAAETPQTLVELPFPPQSLPLGQHLWFLKDGEQSLKESDLLTPEFQQRFAPTTKKSPNFGFSNTAWWARVPLRNSSDKTLAVYITEGYAVVDRIDFWQLDPQKGITAHVSMGDRTPNDLQLAAHRLPSFRMELPHFGIFIDSVQRFLADNIRLLKTNLRFDKEVLKILLINIHTIKGSARSLGLKNLTPLLHDYEQPRSPKLPPVVTTKSKSALWYKRRSRFTRGCDFSIWRIYSQANRA